MKLPNKKYEHSHKNSCMRPRVDKSNAPDFNQTMPPSSGE